jgi:hypothetical protein
MCHNKFNMREPLSTSERETLDRNRNCLSKLTWASREEARAAISYARWQYGESSSRPHEYLCKYCQKWHLARDYRDAN